MKKVFTILMTAVALLLIGAVAKAQGGATPFVGSTHVYTIDPESTSNTLAWSIVESSGYTINSQTIVGDNSVANITWSTAGTYTLQFSETDPNTLCVTVKQLTVEVSANTFDVTALTPAATCNAADGVINYSESTAITPISFSVNMTTGTTFSPIWEIKFTLTSAASITNVDATSGTLTESSGTYTLTGLTSTDGDGTVDITMDVTGGIYAVQTVVLAITSAKELNYNTPDVDSDDWSATQTINPIPQTSDIITD